jgi:hypothetical protein
LQSDLLFRKLEAFADEWRYQLTAEGGGYRLKPSGAIPWRRSESDLEPKQILVKFRRSEEAVASEANSPTTRISLAAVIATGEDDFESHEAVARESLANLQSYLQAFRLSGIRRFALPRPRTRISRIHHRLRRWWPFG